MPIVKRDELGRSTTLLGEDDLDRFAHWIKAGRSKTDIEADMMKEFGVSGATAHRWFKQAEDRLAT